MKIPELMWAIQNNLLPNFGLGTKPPRNMLPPDAVDWEWSYTKQEWQPRTERDWYGRVPHPESKPPYGGYYDKVRQRKPGWPYVGNDQ